VSHQSCCILCSLLLSACLSACLPACVCVQVVEVVYEPSVRHSDSDDEGGADVSDHMDIAGQFKG